MNEQQAREALTDFLAGEIAPQTLDELEAYSRSNPQFSQYRGTVELAWGLSAEQSAAPTAPKMSSELADAIKSESEDVEDGKIIHLSIKELDQLAAAGNGVTFTDTETPDKNTPN